MEDWSGSSIDGSLDDGIDHSHNSFYVPTPSLPIPIPTVIDRRESRRGGGYFPLDSPQSQNKSPRSLPSRESDENYHLQEPELPNTSTKSIQLSEEFASLLIPSCLKLNKVLSDVGYFPTRLSISDIDVENKMISVFVVDSWAASLISCVSELLDRQASSVTSVDVISSEIGRKGASHVALESTVSALKEALESSERRERVKEQKMANLEREYNNLMKQMSDINFENKKKLKNMESLIQESERKLRQKESEYAKLREKLSYLNRKDLSESSFRNQSLIAYRRGEVDNSLSSDRSHESSSTTSSITQIKTRNHTPTKVLGKETDKIASPKKLQKGKEVNSLDVIEALETERNELLEHTQDLENEITSLTTQLKDSLNTISRLRQNPGDPSIPITFKRDHPPHATPEVQQSEGESSSENEVDHIRSNSHRIRQLVHQLEEQKGIVHELTDDNRALRESIPKLKETIDNLRLELGSRPTVKEWKEKLNEVNELEQQLRDVIVMRNESNEMKSWKKHLSTHEKILIDKKNYELKLWLLESLPKAVMKEVLQGICRELELNEVSDIIQAIQKLKAVVRVIPRMEQFISSVCNYVFERTTPTHSEGDLIDRPIMEDVLPVLKKWWSYCQEISQLKKFQQDVYRLVEKVESTAFANSGSVTFPSRFFSMDRKPGSEERIEMVSNNEVLLRIKSLIDFQIEILTYSKNYEAAEKYISERPEILVNSLIEHLQYLYNVNRLEGLLPRLNEVYLFTEEMSNFMSTLRDMLQMKQLPDATVITEVYRLIQESIEK